MPFRFRKIFTLGKGFRLNLSKRGFSTSLGKPGATLNIGKNGVRPTVGIPGSGLSFTPSAGGNSTAKGGNILTGTIVFLISLISICVICVCFFGMIFLPGGDENSTNTPTAEIKIDPAVIIANTSSAAQTHTAIAAPASFTPMVVFTPTLMPAVTLVPTWTVEATPTIFIYTLQTIVPQSTGGDVCSCDGGMDCKDFSTHDEAQACFEYCVAKGLGDVHGIDGTDKDGLACESLP